MPDKKGNVQKSRSAIPGRRAKEEAKKNPKTTVQETEIVKKQKKGK